MGASIHRLPTPMERAQRAAATLKAAGGSAMDCAFISIEVAFDAYAGWHRLKATVRAAIRRGPDDEGNRARYRHLFAVLEPLRLDLACVLMEDFCRRELKKQRIRRDRGVFTEIRLWLRFMRRHAPEQWPAFKRAITRPCWMPRWHADALFSDAAE
jgi:hypothetical protein